jgi:LmbE family N-acetylglucosaminyl deacetylase
MKRTILAVLAHPDDESYGIGGTLARYVAEGCDVHVAIATDGAAGSVDENWEGDRTKLVEARYAEWAAAGGVLGVTLHRFNYRDSGYVGDEKNENPAAFMNADLEEASGKVSRLFEELRPDVVITHDETGGYFHPDHIKCYKIVTAAYHAARESNDSPDSDHELFQPPRLYYAAFPNSWVKVVMFLMRLRGVDPTRAGRNQDIDFTRVGVPREKISTTINYAKYWDVKIAASAEHGSQGGGTSFSRTFPTWFQKRVFANETYIRAFPPVPKGYREKDLFSEPFP